jgi:2-C-methyl-D-erythritol 4-phosphate cytidylyltransferase
VAAGSGERFGERKQYLQLHGRRVIEWSLQTAHDLTDGVVAVVPDDMASKSEPLADIVVAGGASRSASVRAGLAAVPSDTEFVLVHDAARPVPVLDVWRRVIDALHKGADAVVPAIPVSDTLREIEGASIDRSRVVAVQTPQGFRVDVLRQAHDAGHDATDDATLVEMMGTVVCVVDGDSHNIKITEPWHLATADILTR